ncbi:MAG: hypothetical protein ACLTDS_08830 [Bianqueaceae bacterium]
MGRTLVVAEKPSVGRLCESSGMPAGGGRLPAGDQYVITWAIGHLVELCEPQSTIRA